MSLHVQTSPGEFLDKLTILEIKSERIRDPAKLANVRRELDLLRGLWRDRIFWMQSWLPCHLDCI